MTMGLSEVRRDDEGPSGSERIIATRLARNDLYHTETLVHENTAATQPASD
jgi:hypothetical protein